MLAHAPHLSTIAAGKQFTHGGPALVTSPFTGSPTTEIVGTRDGRQIYRCPDTGALFFDRETIEQEHYQDYYPYLRGFNSKRFDWELRIRRAKYTRQLRQMERFAPGRKLLDIGAGPGYLCRVAEEQGWNATGVEISKEAAAHARREFGVTYRRLDEIPEGSVDAITCHHVLEHIADPIVFLQTLRSKLRPRGLVVLHVPHQQPLSHKIRDRLRKLRGSKGDMHCTLYGNIHLSGFTARSLSELMNRAGFETRLSQTAGMWSMYYDPFLLRNYVRSRQWGVIFKKAVRGAIDRAGDFIGTGDWVIGYFSRSD